MGHQKGSFVAANFAMYRMVKFIAPIPAEGDCVYEHFGDDRIFHIAFHQIHLRFIQVNRQRQLTSNQIAF